MNEISKALTVVLSIEFQIRDLFSMVILYKSVFKKKSKLYMKKVEGEGKFNE